LRVVDPLALRAEEFVGQEVDLLLEKLDFPRLTRDDLLRGFDDGIEARGGPTTRVDVV